ncbi:MAG: hypothetical protein ACOWYE_03540, partial [Desulfatiglandales bacterium]
MVTAFDVLLIITAFFMMGAGFSRQRSARRMGREEGLSGTWSGLPGYFLGHDKILRNPRPGTAHLLVFWGVMVPLLAAVLAQFGFSLPRIPARIISLFMDILGLALLVGVLY